MMRSASPLSRRLAWVPAVLALVLTLVFVLACDAVLRRYYLKQASQQARSVAAHLAHDINEDLQVRLGDLQLLARAERLDRLPDDARVLAAFESLRSLKPGFAWVGLIDAKGRVRVSAGAQGDARDSLPLLTGQPRDQAGADEAAGHGWAIPAPRAEGIAADTALADLIVPLGPQGLQGDVLAARLDRSWAAGLRTRALAGHPAVELLLWSSDGVLLLAPGQSGTAVPPELLNAPPAVPGGRDDADRGWLVADMTLTAPPGSRLGWRAVALVSAAQVLEPLRELELVLVAGGVAVAGVLGALAIVWTRRLTGPYERLLQVVSARHRLESGSQPTGLTRYVDEVSRRLDELPVLEPATPEGGDRWLAPETALALLTRDAVRLRQVLDSLPLGVALADGRLGLVFWNAGCERIFGWSADEVLGRSALGLILAEAPTARLQPRDPSARVGDAATQRLERQRKDGTAVWCGVQTLPMDSPRGEFHGWMFLVRDLTDERSAQAQAHEVEQQRAAMAEAAVDWVFARLDRKGRLGQWTPAVEAVFGQTEAQWQGRSVAVLFPFEDVEAGLPARLLARAAEEGRIEHEGWLHRQGGGRFWGNLMLYRLRRDDGELSGYTLVARDLSRRRATEERLRESEATLAAIFASANDAVISTDVGGRVLLMNPAAERIFGYPADQIVGESIERLVPARHRDALRREMGAFTASTLAHRPVGKGGKVMGLRADGSEVRLEGSISQTTVNSQRVLTAILRDVTERVRSERALLEYQFQLSALAQRLMASEQDTNRRVAQVLHDQLGQTLSALRLVFDALQSSLPEPSLGATERVRGRLAELIDRSIREVRQVLVELRPALLQEMGLAAALDNEVRNQSREARQVALVFEPEPDCVGHRWPGDVEYAAFMIAREAIGNALRHARASVLHVRLSHGTPDLRLSVHDDGAGMGEEQHRVKPGHLGLVGMRERALAIGAQLRVQSSPSEGTTIILDWSPSS